MIFFFRQVKDKRIHLNKKEKKRGIIILFCKTMHQLHIMLFFLVFLQCKNFVLASSNTYYAIRPFEGYKNYIYKTNLLLLNFIFNRIPRYGSIFSYKPNSTAFRFYAYFSF